MKHSFIRGGNKKEAKGKGAGKEKEAEAVHRSLVSILIRLEAWKKPRYTLCFGPWMHHSCGQAGGWRERGLLIST